jgi:hypothetical protein
MQKSKKEDNSKIENPCGQYLSVYGRTILTFLEKIA